MFAGRAIAMVTRRSSERLDHFRQYFAMDSDDHFDPMFDTPGDPRTRGDKPDVFQPGRCRYRTELLRLQLPAGAAGGIRQAVARRIRSQARRGTAPRRPELPGRLVQRHPASPLEVLPSRRRRGSPWFRTPSSVTMRRSPATWRMESVLSEETDDVRRGHRHDEELTRRDHWMTPRPPRPPMRMGSTVGGSDGADAAGTVPPDLERPQTVAWR